jgi:hypothetical protein
MENQTVTIEDVRTLSDSLAALPKDANQNQLAEAIANASLVQIAAVSNHGERITGSSERAVAAWFNENYPPTVGELNWFETKHGDKTDMSKTIAGNKSTVYKAWSSANNSVKFGRVQGYGAELAKPMLLELIAFTRRRARRSVLQQPLDRPCYAARRGDRHRDRQRQRKA